jgi:hypothetical protein
VAGNDTESLAAAPASPIRVFQFWAVSSPLMARRPFTVLSALSFVLCAATCVLWVWSLQRPAFVLSGDAATPTGAREVALEPGTFRITTTRNRPAAVDVGRQMPEADDEWQAAFISHETVRFVEFDQGGHSASPAGPLMTEDTYRANLLLPLLAGTPLVALFLRKRQQQRLNAFARRPVEVLCPACGYDLRASPDRCPECGVANVSRR